MDNMGYQEEEVEDRSKNMLKVEEVSEKDFSEVKLDVENKYTLKEDEKEIKDKDEKDEKDKKKKEEKPETVGLIELFKFADKLDVFLIIFGLLNAVICGCIFSVMFIMFGDITDVLTRYQPDGTRNDPFMNGVIKFAYEISLVGLGIMVTHYLFVASLNYSAERQILRIRKEFLAAVLRQDVAWFDTTTTSDFATRMTEDLNKMQDGMGEKVGMLLRFICAGLTAFIYPFIQNWLLSLVLLSLVPILAIMGGVMGKIMTSVSKDEMDNYGAAGAIAEEVLSAVRTVIAFGGQDKEVEKYSVELKSARKNAFIRGTLTATTMGLMFGIIYGMYGLGLWYGVKIMLDDRESEEFAECSTSCATENNGTDDQEALFKCINNCFRFDPGSTVVCVFGILQGGMGMGQSATYAEALNLARAAAVQIFKVISRKPTIDSSSDEGEKPGSFEGHIKFQDVAFNYPSRKDVTILEDFNLEITKGTTVALVGSSGCGKSTCIQLVQRLYDPDSGAVMLDGKDLKDLNVGWLRDNIGIVGQEPVLFDCSIKENICYAKADASDEEIIRACKEANAFDFIEKLPKKLDTLVGEGGAQLSGGQKQRIAIARALIRNPKLLLLDEATSALDTHSEAVVQAALDNINVGRTTIVIAHRLSTVRNADMIVAFENGKVKEKGTHEDLMQLKGLYFSLVERQMAGKEKMDDHEVADEDQDTTLEYSKQISTKEKVGPIKTKQKEEKETLSVNRTALFMRLLSYNMPEMPFIVVGLLGSLLFGVSTPLFGAVFGDILSVLSEQDIATGRKDSKVAALQLAGIGLAFFVAVSLQGLMFSWSGSKLVERLRKKMFETMLMQEMGWFDEESNNTGALCARLSSSAEAVSGGTGAKVGQAVGGVATLIFSTALAIYYNWRLGLATSCFLPPLVLSMLYQMRLMTKEGTVQKEALEKSAKVAVESINNIRTVAGLRCENNIYEEYAAALEKPSKNSKRNAHVRGLIYGFANSFIFYAYGLCFYYGAWLLINVPGSIESPFTIWKVAIAVLSGGMMVGMSFSSLMDIQTLFLAAEKIFDVLDRKSKIDTNASAGLRLEVMKGNTDIIEGEFSYPTRSDVQVLNKLSMSIKSGEKIALVGESGCGKSTVIQLMQRFYDLDQGSLKLEGQDIKHLNVPFVRSNIGIVSQEPVLFNRSIADNIKYGENAREVSMEEVIAAAKKANIHSFVSSLPEGYETNVGGKGKQLSGGQKQRVAIARAMIRNPAILLLDEATSALDSESEKIVQDALEAAQEGRTSITIAHRLSTIMDADNIFVIEKGKVAESGTHAELLNKRGIYHRLWNRSTN